MKQLVVFGDSWPAGSELTNPSEHCFPSVLGELLKIQIDNQSQSGTSVDQALLRLLNYNLVDCGVLFCFTSYARYIRFDNSQDFEVHPNNKDLASLNYYTQFYSDELGKFNFLKNILIVQGVCKSLNIPIYCVTNWNTVPDHKLIDSNTFYKKSLFEILGMTNVTTESAKEYDFRLQMLRNKQYIYPNSSHPNIDGHKLIAQELALWINSQ
jgi:lysophospholipase L1-like esterase